jgi:hypothetical protein
MKTRPNWKCSPLIEGHVGKSVGIKQKFLWNWWSNCELWVCRFSLILVYQFITNAQFIKEFLSVHYSNINWCISLSRPCYEQRWQITNLAFESWDPFGSPWALSFFPCQLISKLYFVCYYVLTFIYVVQILF